MLVLDDLASRGNQPLMIVDGLPLDNKTLNTGVLASDAPGSLAAFRNRGLDFTNRAADLNPEDIESLVVLKGPEASALYGIDAANGAIVITTKRGRPGTGGFEYGSTFRLEATGAKPELHSSTTDTTGSPINHRRDKHREAPAAVPELPHRHPEGRRHPQRAGSRCGG